MKKLLLTLINICLCALLLLCTLSCDNDDDNNCQGIDCLPPITQTGAGTFGCLVNGEPFFAFGGVNCQYQLIDGEYFFVVGFARGQGSPRTIKIESNAKEIVLGENMLNEREIESIYGVIRFDDFVSYATDIQNTGILNITNFDQQNQVISGTFEFEILNPADNQIYQITEGRFDSFFVR